MLDNTANKNIKLPYQQLTLNLGPVFTSDSLKLNNDKSKVECSFSIDKSFRQRFWNYSLFKNQDNVINHLAKQSKINVNDEFIHEFIDSLKLAPYTSGKLKGNYSQYLSHQKYGSRIKSSLSLVKYYSTDEHLGLNRVSKWFKYCIASDVNKMIMFLTGNYGRLLSKEEYKIIADARELCKNINQVNTEVKKLYKSLIKVTNISVFSPIIEKYISDKKIKDQIDGILKKLLNGDSSTDKAPVIRELNKAFEELQRKFVPKTPESLKIIASKVSFMEKIISTNNEFKNLKTKSNKSYYVNYSLDEINEFYVIESFYVTSRFKLFSHTFNRTKNIYSSRNYKEQMDEHILIYVNEYYLTKHPDANIFLNKLITAIDNNLYKSGKTHNKSRTVHICFNGSIPEELKTYIDSSSRILIIRTSTPKKATEGLHTLIKNISTHFTNLDSY